MVFLAKEFLTSIGFRISIGMLNLQLITYKIHNIVENNVTINIPMNI